MAKEDEKVLKKKPWCREHGCGHSAEDCNDRKEEHRKIKRGCSPSKDRKRAQPNREGGRYKEDRKRVHAVHKKAKKAKDEEKSSKRSKKRAKEESSDSSVSEDSCTSGHSTGSSGTHESK